MPTLDDLYGPGATDASNGADHDTDVASEIFANAGYPEGKDEEDWGYALIFAALEIGRKEGAQAEREKWTGHEP